MTDEEFQRSVERRLRLSGLVCAGVLFALCVGSWALVIWFVSLFREVLL